MAGSWVEILVGPDGETKIEVHGVVGSSCEALSHPFEQALGIVTQNTRKPEFTKMPVQQKQKVTQ